jgi:hypothetical protein
MSIEVRTADGRAYRLKSYGGGSREEDAAWAWLSQSSMHNPDAYLDVHDESGAEWQILERDVVGKRRIPD